MREKLVLFLFFTLYVPSASAVFYEVSANYGYDKQVYGDQRQNKNVQTSYSGSIAAYLFSTTALEINYSTSQREIIENEIVSISGTTVNITSTRNLVLSDVYGIGLRQALSSRKAALVPLISMGYAKQFVRGQTEYNFQDTVTGESFKTTIMGSKSRVDSVFGTFSLQIKLTKAFSISGSVNTVFKAFEFNDIKDNLRYRVGFSWIF